MEDCTTPPRRPSLRVNLLHACGSPTNYPYARGCRCVACRAAHAERGRQYHTEHAEEKCEYSRKYYAEHKEAEAESRRRYSAEHRDEKAEYDRKHYAGHIAETAEYGRQYRADHAEERNERRRKHYAEHAEEMAARSRKYNAEHREQAAERSRQRKYGLSTSEWNEMLANQGDGCAICGADDPGGHGYWHTDHDHKAGTVRGILCQSCNVGLGNFRDDPGRLMAAVGYLAIER